MDIPILILQSIGISSVLYALYEMLLFSENTIHNVRVKSMLHLAQSCGQCLKVFVMNI